MKKGRVRWAIVGVGDIVRKRVGAAILEQPDSTMHTCVEIDPEARKEQIDALAPKKVHTQLEPALDDTEAAPALIPAADSQSEIGWLSDQLLDRVFGGPAS